MDLSNLELHNVAETVKKGEGYELFRIPNAVIDKMNVPLHDKKGNLTGVWTEHRPVARECVGIEVRCFSESEKITLKFTAQGDTQVTQYIGDYFCDTKYFKAGEEAVFEAGYPEAIRGAKENSFGRFSKNVWRFLFSSVYPVILLDVTGDKPIRKPKKQETCKKKMLIYGSSISHGAGTPYPHLCYVNVMGVSLQVDVFNKAIGGGCFCEKEMQDFILSQDFDYGYFEMGTNIADKKLEVIEERMGKFIDRLCTSFPDKTLFFVTPFYGLSDISKNTIKYSSYFKVTRKIIKEHASKYANAVILDGHKICKDGYYLAGDVLHPGDTGHVLMGLNAYNLMKKYIK